MYYVSSPTSHRSVKSYLHTGSTSILNCSVKFDLPRTFHVLHSIKFLQQPHHQIACFSKSKLFCKRSSQHLSTRRGSKRGNLRPKHFRAPPPKGIHSQPILLPCHLSGRKSSASSPQISRRCWIAYNGIKI
jgi:hypothetical protein